MIGTDYPHPVVDHAIAGEAVATSLPASQSVVLTSLSLSLLGALCCEKLRSIMAQLQKSVSPIFPPP